MPAARAHLTRYDVEFCGFRQLRGRQAFGCFADTVEDLAGWAAGKTLEETQTFTPGRTTPEDFGVFCIDVARDATSGDAVLVTWNEAAHEEGVVASVDRSSVVGETPELHSYLVPDTDIPGFPTYFLLVPISNAFFTIRTSSAVLGIRGYHRYVEGFLSQFGRHVVRDGQAGDLGDIVGFAMPGDAPSDDVIPRFVSSPARGRTLNEKLMSVREKIYRIERKIDLNYLPTREKGTFASRMLGYLGLGPEVADQDEGINFKSKYSLRVSPTRQQLRQILDSFSYDEENKCDDVGFHIRGQAQPIWLRKALRADDLVLDISVRDRAFLSAGDLLRQLQHDRARLIGGQDEEG